MAGSAALADDAVPCYAADMKEHVRIPTAAPDGRARFTTCEFLRMADAGAFEGMKVELVAGELERIPPPGNRHGLRQIKVALRLGAIVAEELLRGEVGIDLGENTLLGCDAALLRAPVAENRMLLPSDVLLAVEVAESTLARDTGMKRFAYAEAGIPHYWVVDGERSVVHIYGDPVAGDYAEVSTARFGGPLAVPGTGAAIVID